jgi:hypothetical protein
MVVLSSNVFVLASINLEMKKFRFFVLVIFVVLVLLPVFSENASAAYYTSGTLTSTNLLSGLSVGNITSFWYNAASLPSGTTLKVQFSQTGSTWCDSSKNCGSTYWDNCTGTGWKEIPLSGLGWTGANFYYKMQFTSGGANTPILEAVKVDYTPPNLNPTCSLVASPDSGTAPLAVTLDGSGSSDPDGTITKYEWDWTDDGTYDYSESPGDEIATHDYTAGNYTARLRVTDNGGATSTCTDTISVSAPPAYTPTKTMCTYSTASGGGVVSAQDISFPDPDTNPEAISAREWVTTGYNNVDFPTYSELKTTYDYTNATTITNLSDVTGDGIYKVTANDLEIATGDSPPCDMGFSAVIFVANNLIIGRSFTDDTVSGDPLTYRNSCNSSLAFIVSGNINVAQTVNNIYGVFYAAGNAAGTINTGDGSTADPLYIFGSMLAKSFALGRNLGADNANYPAEQVIFMPKYFLTLKDVLGRSQYSWREVRSP